MQGRIASGAISLAVCAVVAAGTATADTTYTFDVGALSDDFLGRPANALGTLQDGFAFSLSHTSGPIELGATIARGFNLPSEDVPRFDLGVRFGGGNWKAGVGKVARHWSPSRHSSLILSQNAHAFPAAYLAKTRATQSDAALFSWLGPWSGEIFVGQTDAPSQPEGAMIAGMRFAFQPVQGLEVDLVRTLQFGGDNQPGGIKTLVAAMFGGSNEGAAASANQMAGIGLSYTFANHPTRVYAQVVGEDEAGFLPSCLMYLAGVETQLSPRTTVSLETVDTRIDETENGFCGPNTAYNNAVYPYRHKGRVLGAAIGSEGRSVNLRVAHDFKDWSLDLGVGYAQINDASDPNHLLSSTRVSGGTVSLGASTKLSGGTLSGVMAYQGFALDKARQDAGLRIGVGFSRSF